MLNKAKCSLFLIKREFLNEYINISIFLARRKILFDLQNLNQENLIYFKDFSDLLELFYKYKY